MFCFLSGWQDSNLRPPGPKPGAMTGLRYTPNSKWITPFERCKYTTKIDISKR